MGSPWPSCEILVKFKQLLILSQSALYSEENNIGGLGHPIGLQVIAYRIGTPIASILALIIIYILTLNPIVIAILALF